jgi:hypothetical protein
MDYKPPFPVLLVPNMNSRDRIALAFAAVHSNGSLS